MGKPGFLRWVISHRSFKEIFLRVVDVAGGWCIRPLSFMTPRSKGKWVIGNKTGWGDNSKYLRIHLEENCPVPEKVFWIAANKVERDLVRSKGLKAYRKWSLKGLYHCLTSGVYVFSGNVADINYWTSGRAKKINLWHGVGLKKLGMKQSDVYDPNNLVTRILTPFFYDEPTYFIAPSDMMADHFAECYRLKERTILKVGYPRCDFLMKEDAELQKIIAKYESAETSELISKLKRYKKVFIYMPTFRDDQYDFIKESGLDFKYLNEVLKDLDSFLLLKLHPATRLGDVNPEEFDHILAIDKKQDIYPILPYTDVLITDYSSIYYDYVLMENKEVILFPFDYDRYVTKSRDFAYDYLTYTPGTKAWKSEELYDCIKKENKLKQVERDFVIKSFWGDNYKKASEKIVEVLSNK